MRYGEGRGALQIIGKPLRCYHALRESYYLFCRWYFPLAQRQSMLSLHHTWIICFVRSTNHFTYTSLTAIKVTNRGININVPLTVTYDLISAVSGCNRRSDCTSNSITAMTCAWDSYGSCWSAHCGWGCTVCPCRWVGIFLTLTIHAVQ
ncbi:hypothetical protein ACH3XW_13025 [Acanthocheilonema viteae]